MYDPNIEPVFSFEAAAQVLGLHRARRLWSYYDLQWKKKQHEANAIEETLAAAANRKKYVWNDDLGGMPTCRMAPHTYVELHRASLSQQGCKGGEYLEDEDYMKFFLKHNEACRIKAVSPHIRTGWTPELERMQQAKEEGQAEREAKQGLIVTEPA